MFYIRTADRLQRTAPWVEALEGGLDHLQAVVCDDSLGIAAELEAAMATHVDGYKDEWAAVLDDPEKLCPLRLLRQRAGRSRPDDRVRRDRRAQGAGAARSSRHARRCCFGHSTGREIST